MIGLAIQPHPSCHVQCDGSGLSIFSLYSDLKLFNDYSLRTVIENINFTFFFVSDHSREGIFDWLLGRQEIHWKFTQRFLREFSGMSLRGLVWTAPQGYALQQMGFGWQYSLSGCLMGFVYYLGRVSTHINSTRNNFFDSNIGFSEFYWGTWIWFVLLVSCLSQLVYRLRKWVYTRSSCSISNPHRHIQVIKYASLNRFIIRLWYEATMVVILLLLSATVMFYSLIIQTDLRNKAQTFFGLFTGVLALQLFLGWIWGKAYHKWKLKKARNTHDTLSDHEQSGIQHGRSPPRINSIDQLEGGGFRAYSGGETDPLLPWPYSHPDKGLADSRGSPCFFQDGFRSSQLQTPSRINYHKPTTYLSSVELAIVILWPSIEKWICLDVFVYLRHLIGVLSLLCVLTVSIMTVVSAVCDFDAPRFDPEYTILDNSSIWLNA